MSRCKAQPHSGARKVTPRKVRPLAPSHRARKWQNAKPRSPARVDPLNHYAGLLRHCWLSHREPEMGSPQCSERQGLPDSVSEIKTVMCGMDSRRRLHDRDTDAPAKTVCVVLSWARCSLPRQMCRFKGKASTPDYPKQRDLPLRASPLPVRWG